VSAKKKKKIQPQPAKKILPQKKESTFCAILPTIIAVLVLAALIIKPQSLNKREMYSVDEMLYNMMANQMTVDLTDYNAIGYYDQAMKHNPGAHLPDYFKKPIFKHPPLYSVILMIPKRFGFIRLWHANYFSFYLSLLLSVAVYFITKWLYDDRTALFAFAIILIEPVTWICSLRVWMECSLALFMWLSLMFFVAGLKNDKHYIFSGIFLGCAMLTKYPGALVAPIIILFVVFFRPDVLKNKKFYLIFGIAGLMFLPWIIWNIRVYGDFFSTLLYHGNDVSIGKILGVIKTIIFSILAILVISGAGFVAYKGYFYKAQKLIFGTRWVRILIGALLICLLFSIKNIRQGAMESVLLNQLPPVSNLFPSIFADGPWFFYFEQLLKMSPFFILAYLAVFNIGSQKDGDKLLIISLAVIMSFYIIWGNYQSRYIVSAIPALIILAARSFWLLWILPEKINKPVFTKAMRIMLSGVFIYFVVKTLIVDMKVAAVLYGNGYYTYF